MQKEPVRCQWCRRILEKNGEPDERGYTRAGVRWYRVRRGYTHAGRCFEYQMKRENSEPVFTAPPLMRLVPP
jgi:hypothetical protein